MASRTASTFIKDIKACGLLSEKQRTVLDQEIERLENKADPTHLARQLVKQGWLTRWQAEMLMNGQTGLTVGHYHMLEILGRGGMGTVFRAKDTVENREVAIKVMAKKLSKNQTLVTRFKREIQAVMSLDSPHVVKAFDAGRIGSILFMVMEVVDGRDLDSIIRKGKRLPAGIACELVRQAAVGLESAHARHMVHRDIKPSNLILTWPNASAPLVKIIDMGLVRSTRDVDDKGVTRDGQAMGTPDYMAPEQALDAHEADIRADVYSLGCTLYRMIAGTVPFRGENAVKVLLLRCQGEPPQLVDRVPDIDPRINAIVLKMMAREPADRYQTPHEAAAALSLVSDVPVQADLKSFMEAANSHASKKTAMPVDIRLNQFLNELAGGEADLISASAYDIQSPTNEAVATLTDFKTASDTGEKLRVQSNRGRGQLLAVGVCITVFVGLLIGLKVFVDSSGPAGKSSAAKTADTDKTSSDSKTKSETKPTKRVVLSAPKKIKAKAGELLSFTIRPTNFLNTGDKVVYSIDESTVKNIKVDPSTGQVEWTPPQNQTTSKQTFVFSARTPSAELIGEPATVVVTVNGVDPIEISSIPDQTVAAGSLVEFDISLTQPPRNSMSTLRLRLETVTVPNPRSLLKKRRFSWQTTSKDVGSHRFWLKLINDRDEVVSEQRFKITIIGPRNIEVAKQTAIVGQQFSLQPNLRSPQLSPAEVRFRLKSGPDGMVIEPKPIRIQWTPAISDVGTHQVEIDIHRKGPTRELIATASFDIVVTAPTSNRNPIPNEEQLAAAREELDELFKKEIAIARTMPARRELSQKLFDRSVEMEPGHQNYALLDLARDLAMRGRDFPAAIECVKELQADYDVDGVELLMSTLDSMRTRDLEPFERQLMPEALFGFLNQAVRSQKYVQADDLLKHLRSIATAERSADLKALVSRVSDLLDRIQGSEDTPPEPDAAELAINELGQLLANLEFTPLFISETQFGFLNHSTGDLADQGQSLWTIDNGRVTLRSEQTPIVTGFIDRSQQVENFVLRMDVAAGSDSGKLIFGATIATGQLDAFEIGLSSSDFGIVRKSGSTEAIARPQTNLQRSPTGWDHLEVEVQGSNMVIRLNNRPLVETPLPRAAAGAIGLDVQLTNPRSQLQVRNTRVRSFGNE